MVIFWMVPQINCRIDFLGVFGATYFKLISRVSYMQSYKVPAWEFYGWKPETLSFPDGWSIHEQRMNGHNARKLSEADITEALSNPVGTEPLDELAKGKKKCCIIFDDMTRPTRQSQMLPSVLELLHRAGLDDDQIVFMMATGAHHGRLLFDFQKKLGSDIPERFNVFPLQLREPRRTRYDEPWNSCSYKQGGNEL